MFFALNYRQVLSAFSDYYFQIHYIIQWFGINLE